MFGLRVNAEAGRMQTIRWRDTEVCWISGSICCSSVILRPTQHRISRPCLSSRSTWVSKLKKCPYSLRALTFIDGCVCRFQHQTYVLSRLALNWNPGLVVSSSHNACYNSGTMKCRGWTFSFPFWLCVIWSGAFCLAQVSSLVE